MCFVCVCAFAQGAGNTMRWKLTTLANHVFLRLIVRLILRISMNSSYLVLFLAETKTWYVVRGRSSLLDFTRAIHKDTPIYGLGTRSIVVTMT